MILVGNLKKIKCHINFVLIKEQHRKLLPLHEIINTYLLIK